MNWKSILIPALVLVALGGVIYWLTTKSRNTTFSAKNTEFAIQDTAAIDEIHLSNMDGQEVQLKRKSTQTWMVNNEFRASLSKVQTLLHTLRNVEVKKPVPLEARENVIKAMASNNVQIDVYKDNNLVRSYYVGHQTPSELGTYMAMNDKDKEPYVTHIPGFYGYLSTRFFADPEEWRSTLIWDFNPANIKEVEVQYNAEKRNTFRLTKRGAEDFRLIQPGKRAQLPNPDQKAVKRYLTRFSDFHCIKDMHAPAKRDSLEQLTPDAEIRVAADGRNKRSLKLYGVFDEETDTTKGPEKADNYYALTPGRPDQVLLVQDLIADPMLGELSDFESSKIN